MTVAKDNLHPKVQVSCLAIKDNQIAMIQKIDRSDSAVYQRFIPPGGHVELHETLEEACAREMLEETGLAVANLKLVGVVSFIAHTSTYHSLCFFFVTHDVKGNLSTNEPEKLFPAWVDLSDFQQNPMIPDYHKEIIKRVLEGCDFLNVRVEWLAPDNRVEWKIL